VGLAMAYFANIDGSGIVLNVISISNLVIGEPEKTFPETEQPGIDFINNTLGFSGEWKQTSYNKNFRKNYAGIGYAYDASRDAFIPPQPFQSWILNENTYTWDSPVPYPNDGEKYEWNEENKEWRNINDPV
jgi:hypothetical protein